MTCNAVNANVKYMATFTSYICLIDDRFSSGDVVDCRRPSYVRQRWYWTSESGQTTRLTTSSPSAGKYVFSSRFRRVLTVKKLTVGDAGVYRCEATYHTWSGPAVSLDALARLTVHGLCLISPLSLFTAC